jgi:hypothetical protein
LGRVYLMDPSPYFRFCPKTVAGNLRWRIKMRRAAMRDPDLQAAIRQACFEDPLFFFEAMLWCYEPRADVKVKPFHLWPTQIPAVLAIEKAIDDAGANLEEPIDVLLDKSRAQGGSLIDVGVIVRRYLKDPMFAAGLVSRNMDYADNPNDPDSLGWKFDWELKMLPFWMRPKSSSSLVTTHTRINRDIGSTVVAYAATGDVASGGRKSLFDFDEVAKFDDQRPGLAQEAADSTQYVANCRIFTSTHKGDSGFWWNMIFGDTWTPDGEIFPLGGSGVYRNESGGVKIVLDWRDNPTQNRLAYRYSGGRFFPEREEEAAEVNAWIAKMKANGNWAKLLRRKYVKEGRLRSPWYDRRCLQKGATPRSIAQELDRDPRGTIGKLFDAEVLDTMEKRHVQPPVWQGVPIVRDGNLHLQEQDDGPLKIWFKPDIDDNPPSGKFVLAVDPATGITGGDAGNSAIEGADATTGEQVLEYVAQVPEARLADIAVALCEWLGDAYLIWEGQGSCGKRFATRVVKEIRYWNVYKRDITTRQKNVDTGYGWPNNKPAHKRDLFEDCWIAMDEGELIPRSAEMITECRGWDEPETDKIEYNGPTGHGDRAIAWGLCHKGMKENHGISVDKTKEEAQTEENEWSMAGRTARRKKALQDSQDDDLAGFRRERVMVERRGFIGGCLAILAAPMALFRKSPPKLRPLSGFFLEEGVYDRDLCAAEIERGANLWYSWMIADRGNEWWVSVSRDSQNCHGLMVYFDEFLRNSCLSRVKVIAIDDREMFHSLQEVHNEVRRRWDIFGRAVECGIFQPDPIPVSCSFLARAM